MKPYGAHRRHRGGDERLTVVEPCDEMAKVLILSLIGPHKRNAARRRRCRFRPRCAPACEHSKAQRKGEGRKAACVEEVD